MIQRIISIILITVCTIGKAGNLPKPVIGAYFPNWAQYRQSPAKYTPANLAPIIDTLNVLWYGFAYFCPNSSMVQPYWMKYPYNLCQDAKPFEVVSIEQNDVKFYQTIINYKSVNKNLKVILSVGGWNFPSNFYSQMVSDSSSRSTFIASAKAFAQKYGFDGIDLDWEYPKSPPRTDPVKISCTEFYYTNDTGGSPQDGANFVELVKEMRDSFGDDMIITVASQADMNKATDEDIKGLFDYIDMFNLMTYDYTVSDIVDSSITAPNEPLYPPPDSSQVPQKDSVSTTINGYLAAGIPPAKMSVGVAYYGHTWFVPNAGSDYCKFGLKAMNQGECCGPFKQTMGAQCGQFSELCGTYMYSEIQRAGFETCFDNVTQSNIGYMVSPQDHYTNQSVWISYQGPETVQAIVDFAKEKKLGGAFAFDISMDSMSGSDFTYDLTKEIAKLEG